MDALVTKIYAWRGPYDGEMRPVCNASPGPLTLGLLGDYLPGVRQADDIVDEHETHNPR